MVLSTADVSLLDALKAGTVTAIRNGTEVPSAYWFGKHIWDLEVDLRFRRDVVIRCWPPEANAQRSTEQQAQVGGSSCVPQWPTGEACIRVWEAARLLECCFPPAPIAKPDDGDLRIELIKNVRESESAAEILRLARKAGGLIHPTLGILEPCPGDAETDWFIGQKTFETIKNKLLGGTANAPAPIRRPPSREKRFWAEVHVVAREWLLENGCPAPNDGHQAELERHVTEWLENRGHEASESSVRRHVANCILEYRKELGT